MENDAYKAVNRNWRKKDINEIILLVFKQKGSLIYKPSAVSFYKSYDGQHFSLIESPVNMTGTKNLLYKISTALNTRL